MQRSVEEKRRRGQILIGSSTFPLLFCFVLHEAGTCLSQVSDVNDHVRLYLHLHRRRCLRDLNLKKHKDERMQVLLGRGVGSGTSFFSTTFAGGPHSEITQGNLSEI